MYDAAQVIFNVVSHAVSAVMLNVPGPLDFNPIPSAPGGHMGGVIH